MNLPPLWPTESALLHHRGPGAASSVPHPAPPWGNLGLWSPARLAQADYAGAAQALADAVAGAGRVGPGAQVLAVGCGAGAELHRLLALGAARVVGVDPQAPTREAPGTDEPPRLARWRGSGTRLLALPALAAWAPPSGPGFDQVLCVDAAYWLQPRADFHSAAWTLLRPGGWLAYTDLTWAGGPAPRRLRWAAGRAGVAWQDLQPVAALGGPLRQAGWLQVTVQPLDEAVLDGFAAFARAQGRRLGWRAWHPAWWRAGGTARLIPPLRRAGLGYALVAARKPTAAGGG